MGLVEGWGDGEASVSEKTKAGLMADETLEARAGMVSGRVWH